MSPVFFIPLGIMFATVVAMLVTWLRDDDATALPTMFGLGLGVASMVLVANVIVHFVVKFW